MLSEHIRLQDMMGILPATPNQAIELAVDIEAFDTLTIQVRKPKACTTGTLTLQHAAVLEEAAFVDLTTTFNLASTTTEVNVYTHCLKFLRWRASSVTGSGTFLIDIIAREL